MPYYHMKEMWTPLKMIGIKFFKTEDGHLFVKVWKQNRKLIK